MIKSTEARVTVDGYLKQYVAPSSETPSASGGYSSPNVAPIESGGYDRNFNVTDRQRSGYVYRHGTPTSPHQLWSPEQHRSFFLSNTGLRSSVDIVYGQSEEPEQHDGVGMTTTEPMKGYH